MKPAIVHLFDRQSPSPLELVEPGIRECSYSGEFRCHQTAGEMRERDELWSLREFAEKWSSSSRNVIEWGKSFEIQGFKFKLTAITIAMSRSVTVSIGLLTNGSLIRIFLVNLEVRHWIAGLVTWKRFIWTDLNRFQVIKLFDRIHRWYVRHPPFWS